MKAICAVCGMEFEKKGNQLTCSSKCSTIRKNQYQKQYIRLKTNYYKDIYDKTDGHIIKGNKEQRVKDVLNYFTKSYND